MAVTATVSGPLLEQLLEAVRSLVGQPLTMRELRSQWAPAAQYYDQQSITGATVYTIAQAASGAEYFTQLFLVFEASSGRGRYMLTGEPVTPTRGFPIPAGGSGLTIDGHDNIRRFQLTAEVGETLLFSRVLFR